MPGNGEVIEGAIQQAAQWGRQDMTTVYNDVKRPRWVKERTVCPQKFPAIWQDEIEGDVTTRIPG
jgi:hypothetical protein